MRFLRDESGYVLVLRRPRLMVVGGTEEKEETAAQQIKLVPRPQVATAACSVPHCCFQCSWCGQQILLPNDKIGSPFGNPDARKIEAQTIATVCLGCGHIANYSMFRNCRGYDTRHRIMHAQRTDETVLLNWLRCDEPLCVTRVPLFAQINPENPLNEIEASGWIWDGLTCALNHPIQRIPLDPTLQLPLRSYTGPR